MASSPPNQSETGSSPERQRDDPEEKLPPPPSPTNRPSPVDIAALLQHHLMELSFVLDYLSDRLSVLFTQFAKLHRTITDLHEATAQRETSFPPAATPPHANSATSDDDEEKDEEEDDDDEEEDEDDQA